MTPDEVQAMTTAEDKPSITTHGLDTNGPRFPRFDAAMAESRRRVGLSHLTPMDDGTTNVLPVGASAGVDKRGLLFALGLLAIGTAVLPVVALINALATPSEAVHPAAAARQVSMPLPAIATVEVEDRDEATPRSTRHQRQPSHPAAPVDTTRAPASPVPEPIAPAPFVRMAPPPIDLRRELPPALEGDREPWSAAHRAKSPSLTAVVDKADVRGGSQESANGRGSTTRTAALTALDYRIQLAAMSAETSARELWINLVTEHGAVLNTLAPTIERQGTLHLLRAGPFASLEEARSVCERLRYDGTDCVLPSR